MQKILYCEEVKINCKIKFMKKSSYYFFLKSGFPTIFIFPLKFGQAKWFRIKNWLQR